MGRVDGLSIFTSDAVAHYLKLRDKRAIACTCRILRNWTSRILSHTSIFLCEDDNVWGDAIFVGRLSHLEKIHVGTDVLDVMKLRTDRIVTYGHMSETASLYVGAIIAQRNNGSIRLCCGALRSIPLLRRPNAIGQQIEDAARMDPRDCNVIAAAACAAFQLRHPFRRLPRCVYVHTSVISQRTHIMEASTDTALHSQAPANSSVVLSESIRRSSFRIFLLEERPTTRGSYNITLCLAILDYLCIFLTL